MFQTLYIWNAGIYLERIARVYNIPLPIGYYGEEIEKRIYERGGARRGLLALAGAVLLCEGELYVYYNQVSTALLYSSVGYETENGLWYYRAVIMLVAMGWILFFEKYNTTKEDTNYINIGTKYYDGLFAAWFWNHMGGKE